jgi:Ca2+-binding EF-hand superfamily protein
MPELDQTTFYNMLICVQESECSPADRVAVFRKISHRIYINCYQMRETLGLLRDGSARSDLMVMMFFRVVDMHNEKIFRVRFEDPAEVVRMQCRLGFLAFFPYIQNEQMHIELDFAFHDQRMAAGIIISLAEKENPRNIRDASVFLPDGTQDHQTLLAGIPPSWKQMDKIPKDRIFKADYLCSPDDRKFEARKRLLTEYGFWHIGKSQSSTAAEEEELREQDVMWWQTLAGVPEDAITFLMFVQRDRMSFENVFAKCSNSSSLDLRAKMTCSQFLDGMKALKMFVFKKKGKVNLEEEQERLKTVFRFLDTSGEGLLSFGEWMVLGKIWAEVELSIQNFANFLLRMFGTDLDEAWDYFDTRGKGTVKLDQWQRGCMDSGYFGPSKQIFHFLDKDVNGQIDRHEMQIFEDFQVKTFIDKRNDDTNFDSDLD